MSSVWLDCLDFLNWVPKIAFFLEALLLLSFLEKISTSTRFVSLPLSRTYSVLPFTPPTLLSTQLPAPDISKNSDQCHSHFYADAGIHFTLHSLNPAAQSTVTVTSPAYAAAVWPGWSLYWLNPTPGWRHPAAAPRHRALIRATITRKDEVILSYR